MGGMGSVVGTWRFICSKQNNEERGGREELFHITVNENKETKEKEEREEGEKEKAEEESNVPIFSEVKCYAEQ